MDYANPDYEGENDSNWDYSEITAMMALHERASENSTCCPDFNANYEYKELDWDSYWDSYDLGEEYDWNIYYGPNYDSYFKN